MLRCTGKLLKRFGGPTKIASPIEPSTRLGDWYAHLLFKRPQIVLCVSERTLLPVLVPARDAARFVPRLRDALARSLRALVPAALVMAETNAMADAVIGKTASRSVLGSINDFTHMLDAYLDGRPALPASVRRPRGRSMDRRSLGRELARIVMDRSLERRLPTIESRFVADEQLGCNRQFESGSGNQKPHTRTTH